MDRASNMTNEYEGIVHKRHVETLRESYASQSVDELRAEPVCSAVGSGALWRQEAAPPLHRRAHSGGVVHAVCREEVRTLGGGDLRSRLVARVHVATVGYE